MVRNAEGIRSSHGRREEEEEEEEKEDKGRHVERWEVGRLREFRHGGEESGKEERRKKKEESKRREKRVGLG